MSGRPAEGRAASERPVSGRWFEDLPEGLVVRHAVTRTITEADNTLFSTMTMNPQPLHLDAQFSAGTEFGERLVNSLFTLGLLVGLSVYELTLGTTIANLGFEKVEFPRPLFHGDTLHAETTVTGARASGSRPDAGIVNFEHRGYNQRDELVALCERAALMRRRPAD
jgi:acyl dehydratase